ncbi:hypothetical protein SNE40_008075 [Patella caerulea]|uniref:Peptidase S1 domain-containing protein n=1 Tax=Patella caerulea TaxID=87958 RepID=A0AAN8K5Z6_PATCE
MKIYILAAAICTLLVNHVLAQDFCQDVSGGTCVAKGTCSGTLAGYQILSCLTGGDCCILPETTTPPTTTTTTTTTPAPTTTTTVPPTTTTTIPPTTTPPAEQRCGVRSNTQPLLSRIFGGNETTECDWPWQVSIRGKISDSSNLVPTSDQTSHFCNGVIIADQWILTTASCVLIAAALGGNGGDPVNNVIVVAGDHNTAGVSINFAAGTLQEKVFTVVESNIHPEYKKNVSTFKFPADLQDTGIDFESNNIALLKLNIPVTYSNCVRKACLLSETSQTIINKDCFIAGWGRSENGDQPILKEAQVELASRVVWEFIHRVTSNPDPVRALTTYAIFVNAVAGGNTCSGDDGGMLVCKDAAGVWSLEGLINRDSGTCEPKAKFLVTDVTAAYPWIMTTIS